VINAGIINECLTRAIFSTLLFEGKAENRNVELDTKMLFHSDGLTWKITQCRIFELRSNKQLRCEIFYIFSIINLISDKKFF
jgi:hypothetical protein